MKLEFISKTFYLWIVFLIVPFLRVNISFYRIRTIPSQLCPHPACQVSDSLLWWCWGLFGFINIHWTAIFLYMYIDQLIKLSSLWSKIYDYMYYYKGLYLWIYVSMKLSVLLNPQALMSTYIYETTVHVEVLTALYPCCLFSFVYCVCDNFRLCMSFIHVALSCEFFCLCIISLYAVVA